MAGITSLQAVTLAGGSGLRFTWDFSADLVSTDAPNKCTDLYLYLNKIAPLNDGEVRQVRIVPLKTNDALTRTFDVSNLDNGTTYLAQLEATVQTESGLQIYTKVTTGKPSTIPPKPLIQVGQDKDSGFYVKLVKDLAGSSPTPLGEYDGYETLTGIYVIYATGLDMKTVYIPAGDDIDLYNDKLQVEAPFGDYEIAVSIANINGRSLLSDSLTETVDTSIRGPRVVHIVEEMAIDPSASATYSMSKYTTGRILLAWNAPENLGTPAMTHYGISRSEDGTNFYPLGSDLSIATVANNKDALTYNVDASFVFIDTNVEAGKIYQYNIVGVNANGVGLDAVFADNLLQLVKNRDVTCVVWPTVSSFVTVPGNTTSEIDISVDGGFDNESEVHTYDVSYSRVGSGVSTLINKTKPIGLTGLLNNTSYLVQVRGRMQSPNAEKEYVTNYSSAKQTTPIDILPSINNLTATAIDSSNNPLNGKVVLSWKNPSNVTSFSGIHYIVEKKFGNGSYSFDTSAAIVAGASVEIVRDQLTNGVVYSYRVKTSFFNQEVGDNYTSDAEEITIMPFNNPDSPLSLTLTSINSSSDLSFSFLDFSSNMNWGSPIVGHRYTLYNRNNGLEDQVGSPVDLVDGSFNLNPKKATLSEIFGQLNAGTRYALDVQSFIEVNGLRHYSTKRGDLVTVTSLVNNWTRPTGISSTTVTNVTNNGMVVPLSTTAGSTGGRIRLSWNYPVNQDASSMTFRVVNKTLGGLVISSANYSALTFDVSGISVGALSQTFFVQAVLNESVNNIISLAGSDVNGTPVFYPDKVGAVNVNILNSTSVNYQFNRVSYHGGMDSANTRYIVQLVRMNGNVETDIQEPATLAHSAAINGVLTGSFEDLVAGDEYKIRVTTEALNPMVDQQFIRSQSPQTITTSFTPYELPFNIEGFQINPADSAIVVKWNPLDADPEGLDFESYTIQLKETSHLDTSYVEVVSIQTKTLSVYSILDLTNGVSYDVRMRSNYTDRLGVTKSSNNTTKLTAVPDISPSQPTNLTMQLNSFGSGGIISWDLPSNVAPVPTNYSLVIEGSGNNYFLDIDHMSISDSRLVIENGKLNYTLANGLLLGNKYIIRVYAEVFTQLDNVVYYSSSIPVTTEFQAYASAQPPLSAGISAKLGNESITVTWNIPTDTGGQGDLLEYRFYFTKGLDDLDNPIKLDATKITVVDKNDIPISPISGTNDYRLTSLGNLKPLDRLPLTVTNQLGQSEVENFVEHKFFVASVFTINGTDNLSTYSNKNKLFPRQSPNNPEITATVIDNSGIQLTISSDASFNLEKYIVYRSINNGSVETIQTKEYTNADTGIRQLSVFDTKSRVPTNGMWLEGNTIKYYVMAKYNDDNINSESGTNGDEELISNEVTVIPRATVFPCGIDGRPLEKVALMSNPDISNNLFYYVNRAGSTLNSVNAIVLDASNVGVLQWSGSNVAVGGISVTYVNNSLIAGVTAANQVSKVNINLTAELADNMSDIVAVNANSSGTCLAIYPQDGVFSNLKDQLPN
jgi:hypothetical protein